MLTRKSTGKPPTCKPVEQFAATDFRWAVYTPLTRNLVFRDYYPPVEKFRTKEEALDWQNAPVRMVFRTKEAAAAWREAHPNGPPAVLISESDSSVMGAVRLRVPDNSLDRPTVDDEFEIEPPSAPAQDDSGQAISRWDRGRRGLVEIRYLRDYTGPKFEGKTIREFLPPEAISDQPGRAPGSETDPRDLLDRITPILDRRDPEVTCSLGEDWDFAAESEFGPDGRTPAPPRRTIDDDAWRRGGHQFRGRWKTTLHALAEALYDLEDALRSIHPDLPAPAIADFWTSLEIERHLAEVCRKLAGENPRIPEREIENARYNLRVQLAAYAHEIRPAVPILQPVAKATPAATGPRARRHGPKEDKERHCKILSIVKRVCGEGWEQSWPQKLDTIQGELDNEDVPFPSTPGRRGKYAQQEVESWLDMSTPKQLRLVKERILYSIKQATNCGDGGTNKDRLAA